VWTRGGREGGGALKLSLRGGKTKLLLLTRLSPQRKGKKKIWGPLDSIFRIGGKQETKNPKEKWSEKTSKRNRVVHQIKGQKIGYVLNETRL